MLAHWDDVERFRGERGPMASWLSNLGRAAGTRTVGVTRWQIDAGKRSTPTHVELAEEEIFYVLGGSGLVWINEATCSVGAGDCVVCLACEHEHTFVAGEDGLDVLAFGQRSYPGGAWLPRAGVVRIDPAWVASLPFSPSPWDREVEAGELELPEPGERPPNVTRPDEIEGAFGGRVFDLGRAAGSERTGLKLARLDPGHEGAPPHCHSAEEEIFVVLEGGATLTLTPSPASAERGAQEEQHELRAGHVVSRAAGTGVCHSFRAGEAGVTYLAYGTREPNDITYYQRSATFYLRGVGVHGRVDQVSLSER